MKKVDLKIQNENSVTYLLKVVFGNTGTSGISFTPIGLQMKLPLSLFLTRLDAAQCAVKLGKMCNFGEVGLFTLKAKINFLKNVFQRSGPCMQSEEFFSKNIDFSL